MKTILFPLVAASAAVLPSAAMAQALPAAVIAVVDVARASNECTACKAAAAQLDGQAKGIQAREKQLTDPLKAEAAQIEAAVKALGGKEADAALQKRYADFQAKQQAAGQELQQRQNGFARNQAFAMQQIEKAMEPVLTRVMQARGANILLDARATMQMAKSVDITDQVLAEMNKSLTSVATTAPAPTQQQTPPKGR